MHEQDLLLAELRPAGQLDLNRCAVDSSHVRVLKRGDHIGPPSVNRGHTGSKRGRRASARTTQLRAGETPHGNGSVPRRDVEPGSET
jgi:hypothetical protein